MNRRSFITKALAGIAAVPLLGKLIQARTQTPPRTTLVNGMPMLRFSDSCTAFYSAGSYDSEAGIWYDQSGNGNHLLCPVSDAHHLSTAEFATLHKQIADKFGITLR